MVQEEDDTVEDDVVLDLDRDLDRDRDGIVVDCWALAADDR